VALISEDIIAEEGSDFFAEGITVAVTPLDAIFYVLVEELNFGVAIGDTYATVARDSDVDFHMVEGTTGV
jgi:hypothetical protein